MSILLMIFDLDLKIFSKELFRITFILSKALLFHNFEIESIGFNKSLYLNKLSFLTKLTVSLP